MNSRELRRVVDEAIENADVKPNTVRFFRGAMFNMVSKSVYKGSIRHDNDCLFLSMFLQFECYA